MQHGQTHTQLDRQKDKHTHKHTHASSQRASKRASERARERERDQNTQKAKIWTTLNGTQKCAKIGQGCLYQSNELFFLNM